METVERINLRQNHVTLVDELDPCDIMDDLCQEGILTENDCDHIKSGKSRKDKCRSLLTLLPTRGPSAYGSFLKSLKVDYDHLACLLQCPMQDMDTPRNERIHEELVDIPLSFPNKAAAERSWKYSGTEPGVDHINGGHGFKACSDCRPLIPDFAVPELEALIKQHCCLILENVEVNDLLDLHYQEFVLGGEEYERIRSRTTRKERCIAFILELSKCNRSQVTSVFTRSLEKKYGYIANELRNATQVTENLQKQPITADAPRPILAEVLRMGIRAQTANPMKKVPFYQPQSPHFKGKQLENGRLDATDYKEMLADDISDVEWAVRRCRHLKQERWMFDKRSRHGQLFTYYEDNVADNRLPFSCPVEHLMESNMKGDHQRQSSKWKAEINETISSLVDDVHHTQGRRKVGRTNKEFEHPGESEMFGTNPLPRKGTMNIQRKEKSFGYVKSVTKTNRYPYDNCRTTDENKTRKSQSKKRRALPTLTMPSSPGAMIPHELRSRRLEVAFNFLSTMINQGHFQKFENLATKIQLKYGEDDDMMCILDYLHASRDLFITDIDSAKRHINTGLQRVAKTSNPRYFTLELFSAQTRMYLAQRKLHKLESTLDDAKMIIETDPAGCSGRAAGWLFMNDVRDISSQLAALSVHRPKYPSVYKHLHDKAVNSCRRALDNFNRDGGKDGPFGIGFALCRLAILLLRCGDNGLTMDVQHPDSEDIELAGNFLKQLENSNIPIPKILELHNLLAKSDLQYRRDNSVRALEHAEAAYHLAKEINILEFTEHAHNRVVFLKKMPVSIEAVNEEEVSRILFDDSADSY